MAEQIQALEDFPEESKPTQPSASDLRRGEELIAAGWKPHPKLGGEFLVEPGQRGGKGQPARRSIHIPGLAP